MTNLSTLEEELKKQYREQLLADWYATEDNQYFLKYQRQCLYRLVKQVRWHSNPTTRLNLNIEAEALAEFLQDYDKEGCTRPN